jgi:hypothetical protein
VRGVPQPATAARRATIETGGPDEAQLIAQLNWLLRSEIDAAVGRGILTEAEAEQLLARLALVIDQAITPARP